SRAAPPVFGSCAPPSGCRRPCCGRLRTASVLPPHFRGRSCKATARKAIPRYPGYGQPKRLLRLPIIISLPGEDHMTRWATLAIALLFSAIATVHTTGTASGQDGWTALFDGKNLDQWDGDGSASFIIEDGAVTAKDKK